MKSQTARRPDNQRSTRSAKSKKYVKQTAHVEARRDGTPLIFGWGGHLSHSEKTRLQRRLVWAVSVAVVLLIIAVIVGFWININVITPNLPITSVNGQPIPQSDYRKLLALKAQMELNKLYGPHGLTVQRDNFRTQSTNQQKIVDNTNKQIDALNKQIKALPAGPSAQRTNLEKQLADAKTQLSTAETKLFTAQEQYQIMVQNTIPQEQQLYNQSQLGNDSANWLQDDVFIRNWLARQNSSVQAQVAPSASAINNAVRDFAANIPTTSSYSKFLSSNNVSDTDVHTMIALTLRRSNMQTYLASLIKSPTYQVLVRTMTLGQKSDAENVLKQLKQGADFGKLAKQKSVDVNTKDKGGDLGWIARGQYAKNEAANASGSIDNWIFDPARKLNELSPVLTENGAYHIVQIMNIDPARPIDDTTLKALKDNALDG
ncbi:MAG: peptidylprolyl isomerase [Chloroflexi bacterium]|nr:peptidylprolyl isomerase [Chloroflexota bacterium]